MVKWVFGGAAVLLIALGGLFALLASGMSEPKGLALTGWMTGLYVPSEIRTLPQIQICGALEVSKSLQECGGICGERYDVRYPSSAAIETLQEALDLHNAGFPQYEVSLDVDTSQPDESCVVYSIEYYFEY